MHGRVNTEEGVDGDGLSPIPIPLLILEWSADTNLLRDGIEIGVEGLGMEPVIDGSEDIDVSDEIRLRDCFLAVKSPWQPPSSDVINSTSTLLTLLRPHPMGGAISWTGARNKSDPIRSSAFVSGRGLSSWLLT